MQKKEDYTLKEIVEWTQELKNPRSMITIRNWFSEFQPVNGKHKPSRYSIDDVVNTISKKLKISININDEDELLQELKIQDDISWRKDKENEQIYPYFEATEAFYRPFGDDPDDYEQAAKYAKEHKQEFLNELLIHFFLEELGYKLNIKKIEKDLFNKFAYQFQSPKTKLENGKIQFENPNIPIWFQSKQNIDTVNLSAYIKKIKK